MSGFHDVRFPADISLKASGGPEFKTQITELNNGREQRNLSWQQGRNKYQLELKNIGQEQAKRIIGFFSSRRGKTYSFRFKDWADFEAKSQQIGIADGTTTDFQLIKTYGNDENKFYKKITKPVATKVTVFLDGSSADFTYDINYSTGVISFHSAPSESSIITADFEFDFEVRFDTDFLSITTEDKLRSTIKKLELVEVK